MCIVRCVCTCVCVRARVRKRDIAGIDRPSGVSARLNLRSKIGKVNATRREGEKERVQSQVLSPREWDYVIVKFSLSPTKTGVLMAIV